MKKSARVLWMAAAAAVLAAPCALAGEATVKADVPFAFQAGGQQLPSGTYRFVAQSEAGLLLIYSAGSGEHLATVFGRTEPVQPATKATVAFHQHGGESFLKWVRSSDGTLVSLAETRTEAQAQARADAEARARATAAEAAAERDASKTAMP